MFCFNRTANRARTQAAFLLIALLLPCAAQAADPDYSRVDDILLGRRTLVAVNDLVIGSTVMKTSDGTKIDDKDISQLPGFQRHKLNPEIFANLTGTASGDLVYAYGRTVYAIDPVSQRTASLALKDDFSFAGMAAGDFRGDGRQEVVVASFSGIRIVSAANPMDLTQGLQAGPEWRGAETLLFRPAVVVGHFDRQGPLEVAIAFDNAHNDRGELAIFQVEPKTLELQLVRKQAFTSHPGAVFPALVAGRFGNTLNDQLFLGYYDTANQLTFQSFDFDGSLGPVLRDSRTVKGSSVQELNLQSARFDPRSPLDQAALKVNDGRDAVRLGIVTFDSNLKIGLPNLTTLSGVPCSSGGLSAGNFARTEPAPQNSAATQRSLKLQVALSTSNCAGSASVNIYNIDPPQTAGAAFTINATAVLSRSLPQSADYGLPVISGDIQGRSVLLGDPTKIVIEDTAQPSVIAAMPPMHVDFVRPSGSLDPALLNLSAIPDGFRTVYQTTDTNSSQSSNTSTNSWSFGTRIGLSASFEIGSVADGLGVEVAATAQAAEDVKTITEKEIGSYRSNTFDASVKTGFADQVWYTDSRFNIYTYPVIGHNVCPASTPNCDKPSPLTIQFSGPDKIESHRVDGNLIPWYQPPWEPGNVFSYPANYGQLQKISPNIQLLSNAQTSRTDTSTATERATWTAETSEGATAGVDQNYSFELGLSVSGAWSAGVVGGTASASLNLSGSTGLADLNKSSTSVGRSAGIGVDKPGTFLRPTSYNYPFTPYIFGQTKPASVVDHLPAEADVNTFGLLRTAFTADPANSGAGSWWQKTYHDKPDVALNHPSRWHWRQVGGENPLPSNCLNVGFSGTNMDCIDPEPRRPDNLWESSYHVMRGLFISNRASAPGSGTQLTTSTAGDMLRLQARVYNYSFAPLPQGSEVRVRFYAEPIDKDNGHQPVGDSSLINEVVLPQIPPFDDRDDAPLNWVLASTDFDTTNYAGKYLVFWVVVWIQDGSGHLVPEVDGHGLQSLPATLKSFADVQEEAYSNNVGFYNAAFYVFPKESVSSFATALGNGEPAALRIQQTNVSAKRLSPNQQVDVTATVAAGNGSASGVTALFYDGNPHEGGVVFGLERIPYLAENDSYTVEAPYIAGACGKHELFVALHEGTPDEVLQRLEKIKVDCR